MRKFFIDNIVSHIDDTEDEEDEEGEEANKSFYETGDINFVDYQKLQEMIKNNKNICISLNGSIKIGKRTIEVLREIIKNNISFEDINLYPNENDESIIISNELRF